MMRTLTAAALAALLAACAGGSGRSSSLPDKVRAPDDQRVAFEARGSGTMTYECQERNSALASNAWTLVKIDATLSGSFGLNGLRFSGPPPTWDDGSTQISGNVTGTGPIQARPGDLPPELVKITRHNGRGSLADITYVQRMPGKGGVVPGSCTANGARETSRFEADYIFYRAR